MADTKAGRILDFKDNIRFWNISKVLEGAAAHKPRSYLKAAPGIIKPPGGFIAYDPVGRPLDDEARIIIVREIRNGKNDMNIRGALAIIERARGGLSIVSRVPKQRSGDPDDLRDLRILLPDSGANVSEITWDTARKLGLYDQNSKYQTEGGTIHTSTGEYDTWKVRLTITFNPEDIRLASEKYKGFHFPGKTSFIVNFI